MTDILSCWKCGNLISDLPLPLSRLAECVSCRADLHVCKMCTFYDVRSAKHCREPIADEVLDKQRANFCGYFYARPDAYQAAATTDQTAQLEALFGKTPNSPTADQTAHKSAADLAREELEKLFGKRSEE